MTYVSVSDVVEFYRCKACFVEKLKNGGRGRQTVKSLLGEMLHEFTCRCLRGEADIIEELHTYRRLDLKSLQQCYREAAEDVSRNILWRYGGRLVGLGGSPADAENLLLRASENMVEHRVLELFRGLRSMGLQQLLLHLYGRSFNKRLYLSDLRVCGSPDMLEADRVIEFKYSRPGPTGMVREDIVLQLSLYSILSGRRGLEIIYLPSFVYERFQVNGIMIEWALKMLEELFSFLSNIPGTVDHTCIHGAKYVHIGCGSVWTKSIYSRQ
jgi:hypothetical protein